MDWRIIITEIDMNRLALGTVQFGLSYGIANQTGQVDNVTANSMLKLAKQSGVDALDTAVAYGNSEESLGKLGVQDFKVVTKLPPPNAQVKPDKAWVRNHLQASLQRLNVNSVYGLLLHRFESLLEPEGMVLYEALQELKAEGLVNKIGVSVYNPSEVIAITDRYAIDLIQMPFNLIDRRLHNSGCLSKLKDKGVEVHVRSAFLQGLLLMQQAQRPEKFSAWSNTWNKWHDWLDSNPISSLHACLSYPLAFPEIDRVVVGADSVQQLQEIIEASNNPILLTELPDLACNDENLINPSRWSQL